MKKFTVYDAHLDDERDCMKVTIPAQSEKQVLEYVEGNGEVITIKKNKVVPYIDVNFLTDVLEGNGCGKQEISIITNFVCICSLDR